VSTSALVPVVESVRWSPDRRAVRIVDQRRLPAEFIERDLATTDEVCDAIRTLAVRGAPAIGICGAMGLVVAAARANAATRDALSGFIGDSAARIAATRPTGVNLAWALDRVQRAAAGSAGDPGDVVEAMRREATAILDEDRAMCRRIGVNGVVLLSDGVRVLTHCNAGALATGGIGTALAPLYVGAERGLRIQALVDETRPLLQGSRLTAWELARAGIPTTVITDSTAGALMQRRDVDLCLVGADRVAANGDVANKIGTYPLAVLARHHGIPFYVAIPTSTLDPDTPSGESIRIEERDPLEVLEAGGVRVAAEGVSARNPAFDVTPAELVSAIITDTGIHWPPFDFAHGV
jgi:methylthioribose-1-phosphate isomerase